MQDDISSLNTHPLVSVCIVTWNRIDKLKRCVESVLMQEYKDIEFVILDNCSNDGTLDYLHTINDGNIIFKIITLPSPDDNAVKTLNMTFREASGKYILVMDDDAYFINEFSLVRMVSYMELYEDETAILGCNVVGPDGKPQLKVKNYCGDLSYIKNCPQRYYDFKGACALFNKDIISNLGFYDESFKIYMNELDLSLKCLKEGYDVIYNNGISVVHDGVSNLKNAHNYLENYNTVIYWNFSKYIGIKSIILNYFIVSYLQGYWVRNLKTTLKFIIMIIMRFNLQTDPTIKFVELSIYNGMKKDMLGKIGL
jgi:GT2 family glycosyltransferase